MSGSPGIRHRLGSLFVAGAALAITACVILAIVLSKPRIRLPEERAEPVAIEDAHSIQLENQNDSQDNSEIIAIEGAVLDESGQGYGNVKVYVKPVGGMEIPGNSTITDSYGRFCCYLSSGEFIFKATEAGAIVAATKEYAAGAIGEPDLILYLPRAHQISGRIVNASAEPIPDAHIALYAKKNYDGITVASAETLIASTSYTAICNASGEFNFSALWPGTYLLNACATGYLAHADYNVPAGTKDKTIILGKEASLRIHVVDDGNEPVFLASVQLLRNDKQETRIETKETTQSGEVRFSALWPGNYIINAVHTDYTLTNRSTAEIEIDRDSFDATLVLKHKDYSISGRIIDAKTHEPVAEFPLSLLPPDWTSGNEICDATSNPKGFFRFDDIPRGKYRIGQTFQIEKAHPYTLLSGRNEMILVDVEDKDLEGIEILAYRGPRVTGRVYDRQGNPVRLAYVQLTRGWTLTDENGAYEAWLWLYRGSLESNFKSKKRLYASHPQHGSGESELFDFEMGSTIEGIDIVLDQSVTIAGQVTDASGQPILDAEVEYKIFANAVYKKLLHLNEKTVFPVDQQGRYEIPNAPLMPGDDVRLTAKASGYQEESRRRYYFAGKITKIQKAQNLDANQNAFWLKGKDTVTEDFQLAGKDEEKDDTPRIRGIVLDRNGAPMKEIALSCRSMEIDINRPQGTIRTITESDGSFVFENLQEDTRYYLIAQMEKQPYLEKEEFPVPSGTEDVIICLDFAPVELTVQIDDSHLKSEHNLVHYWITVMSIDRPDRPAIRERCEKEASDPNMVEKSVMLKSPGIYQVYVQGSGGDGTTQFEISHEGPRQKTIRIVLEPLAPDKTYGLLGCCVDRNKKPANEKYRVRIRRIDTSASLPFLVETNSFPDSEIGNYFMAAIDQDGLFEVLYFRMDGIVFHRTLVSLAYSQAAPWNGEEEAKVIVLPEVIYHSKIAAR